MIRQALSALLLLVSLIAAGVSSADQLRPALLDIRETQPGWFQVTWKLPLIGDRMPPLTWRLTSGDRGSHNKTRVLPLDRRS